jgi:hypothetical protein
MRASSVGAQLCCRRRCGSARWRYTERRRWLLLRLDEAVGAAPGGSLRGVCRCGNFGMGLKLCRALRAKRQHDENQVLQQTAPANKPRRASTLSPAGGCC